MMPKREVNAMSKGRAAKGKRETAGDPITAYPRALRRGETDKKYLGVLDRINRAAAGMPQKEDASMYAKGGMVDYDAKMARLDYPGTKGVSMPDAGKQQLTGKGFRGTF
jgi:hypothetical protein